MNVLLLYWTAGGLAPYLISKWINHFERSRSREDVMSFLMVALPGLTLSDVSSAVTAVAAAAQSAQLQLVMAILGPNKPYNNVESHAKHYFALVSPAICAYSMENHLLLHFYVKLVVPACQHFTVDALELLYYQAIATMAAACIGKGQKGRPSDTFLWLSGL